MEMEDIYIGDHEIDNEGGFFYNKYFERNVSAQSRQEVNIQEATSVGSPAYRNGVFFGKSQSSPGRLDKWNDTNENFEDSGNDCIHKDEMTFSGEMCVLKSSVDVSDAQNLNVTITYRGEEGEKSPAATNQVCRSCGSEVDTENEYQNYIEVNNDSGDYNCMQNNSVRNCFEHTELAPHTRIFMNRLVLCLFEIFLLWLTSLRMVSR